MMKGAKHTTFLTIGAIGIVFGDIGTSPLYALQSIFHLSGLSFTSADARGVVSLILWSMTLIVTIKYMSILMRINNNGEGGILALVGLVRQTKSSRKSLILFTLIGILGVSLFFGDGVITPAISVLSAVEGMTLVAPSAASFVIPVALAVLFVLFLVQSRGTGTLGKFFGPIMILWFVVSALGGLSQIIQAPEVLQALLPTTAIEFFLNHPLPSFLAMGAVILSITGAEALYADMGHFGKKPIRLGWLLVIFPALALTYLGQGALISTHPDSISSAYYLMFPDALHIPIIILATIATLIASQAVIAGAFSIIWQATRLNFLPRIQIVHTSRNEYGQVYIPLLNWLMFSIVVAIILGFGSSKNLAAMFGLAVSGTLFVDSIFLLIIMRKLWRSNYFKLALVAVFIMSLELVFISSGLSKILYGAWVALVMSAVTFILMSTWFKGQTIVRAERKKKEDLLEDFVKRIHAQKTPRVKGSAVYIGHHANRAPLALHAALSELHELHEKITVVTIKTTNTAHVPEAERTTIDNLGNDHDGISHLTIRFGFKDMPNIPRALELVKSDSPELYFDPYKSTYFTSTIEPVIVKNRKMALWRKRIFLLLSHNANSKSDYFKLPTEHTIEMTTFIEL